MPGEGRNRSAGKQPWRLVRGLACSLALCSVITAQVMLFDRGLQPGADTATSLTVRLPAGSEGFIGDEFTVGEPGESWVIDAVRTWAVQPPDRAAPTVALADLFDKISLYGGLASDPPSKDEVVCGCHALPALSRDGHVSAVSGAPESARPRGVWQVDFDSLRWSVPGGVRLQFGVEAEGRGGAHVWFNHVSATKAAHRLRVFGPTAMLESWLDEPASISVQVWGHLMARVKVETVAAGCRVTLFGQGAVDIHRIDVTSLRFGPAGVRPSSSTLQASDDAGGPALVLTFPSVLNALPPGPVSLCLSGLRADGVPFEGCDLVDATARPRPSQ